MKIGKMKKTEQQNAVVLYALFELNGASNRKDTLEYIQNQEYWRKNDSNDETLKSRNEKRWRNNLCYAKKHLLDAGYMLKGDKDNWQALECARIYLNTLTEKIVALPNAEGCDFTEVFYQKLIRDQAEKEDSDDEYRTTELVNQKDISVSVKEKAVIDEPAFRNPPSVTRTGKAVYKRDPEVSQKALYLANYQCELDKSHTTFLRRNANCQYMEPHHLIPMSESENFEYSLDREQNIFSLCCNCHKQIHYGRKEDVRTLVKQLFEMRKNKICKVIGREISLEDLYRIYGVIS